MEVAIERGQCHLVTLVGGSVPLGRSPSCVRLLLPSARRCSPSPSPPRSSSSPIILFTSPPGRLKLGAPRRLRPFFAGRDDDNLSPNDYQPSDHRLLKTAKFDSDIFVKWEVPWDGKTVIVTMTAFGLSFLFTGLAVSLLLTRLGFRQRQLLDFDERSLLVFISQILQTIVGTSVIKTCLKDYSPFPSHLFNYDWRDPLSPSRGWLLWSVVGIFCGTAAVLLAGTLTTYVNGEPLPREGQDALLQLLPLIGASSTSTALLLAVTGILAPYLEETVFRGFLMTSLTKWLPTYAAVILSAGAFALAHFTPGEIPQLFALGVVLGFSYAKSGNLLTPIVIHGMWNSGVLLLLTFLRLQGFDLQELI